jgi:hypothetical protein
MRRKTKMIDSLRNLLESIMSEGLDTIVSLSDEELREKAGISD